MYLTMNEDNLVAMYVCTGINRIFLVDIHTQFQRRLITSLNDIASIREEVWYN